ncbi:hypothetical protein ACQP3J_29620, partial [Escherichia coli]
MGNVEPRVGIKAWETRVMGVRMPNEKRVWIGMNTRPRVPTGRDWRRRAHRRRPRKTSSQK